MSMKPMLYILAESDKDALFFEECVNRTTGRSFTMAPIRRRRGGVNDVRRLMSAFLHRVRYTAGDTQADSYFVIAMDNDRRPAHPRHGRPPDFEKLPKSEQAGGCRFCEIQNTIEQELGHQAGALGIKGAIAVPVQMLESWLLLICNAERWQNEGTLPLFARKDSASARAYYSPGKPPEQLKDLCDTEMRGLDFESKEEFLIYCGESLAPGRLRTASGSFALFEGQVNQWFESPESPPELTSE
jgi:hypothetical protein